MAEKEKTTAKKVNIANWKARKLKAVNEMKDEAKAKEIAGRIMKVRG